MNFPSPCLTIQVSSDHLLKWNLSLLSIWESLSLVSPTPYKGLKCSWSVCQMKPLQTGRALSSRHGAGHCTQGSLQSPGPEYSGWFKRPCQPSPLMHLSHLILFCWHLRYWCAHPFQCSMALDLELWFEASSNYISLLNIQTEGSGATLLIPFFPFPIFY